MAVYQYQSVDLDLDKLEYVDDPEEIARELGGLVQSDNDYKVFPARTWVENFLYYAGVRDFYNRFGTGTVTGNSIFNLGNLGGASNYQSRRRISKTFKACQVQASNITRQKPTVKVWPTSDDEVANKQAKLSNITLDFLWDFDFENDLNYEAILWSLLTPAIARKDYLDYSFSASRIWPQMQDIVAPYTGVPMKTPMLDGNGQPMMEQHPWNKTKLVSAFRLLCNFGATWLHDVDFIGDYGTMRIQEIRDNYDRNEEGFFPENVQKLRPGNWMYTATMAMENALKQLAFGAFRAYKNYNYTLPATKDGCTYVHLFIKPSRNYPKGREIFVANGLTLYNGNSRSFTPFPLNWNPYSLTCYERVPGRLWGTTYAEKIVDINRAYEQERTQLDKLTRTFSVPKMAAPIGCQIERDTITGDEQVFRYNPFGPDGGKPAYLNAPQPPTTIVDSLKLTGQEFVEMSGVTEIMQGIRPQGVTTYRGLEVLREESNNSQNNFIRMYEDYIQRSQFLKLENIRKALTYTDQNMVNAIRIFKRQTQYITDVDIQNFTGQDLSGYVVIEPFSSIGKSRLAMQEKYMSMAQMGILGDIVNDPDLNSEFKRKMDVLGFDTPQDRQVIYARWENQMMLEAQNKGNVIVPPVEEYHDDVIHIRECENLLLDPSLQEKQLIIESVKAHKMLHQEQQARKMAMQMQAAQAEAAAMAGGQKPKEEKGKKTKQPKNAEVTPGQGQQGVLFGPENGFVSGGESNQLV